MLNLNFEATGTKWNIVVFTDSADESLEQSIQNLITEFENTYSRFKDTSFVHTISVSSGEYSLPQNAKPLLDIYRELEEITKGAFTPLIGQNLVEAGYDTSYSFNSKEVLSENPRFSDVFSYAFPKLVVKNPASLDFGAAGKGYLMDLIADLLKSNGYTDFLIDAGHDYVISTSQKPISIGLEDPNDSTSAIGLIELKNGSICGSSGNRRNWGKYNHIINGQTKKSSSDILATWVVAESGLLADALSTAVFFVDPLKLKEHYQFEYVILYSDFSVNVSANFSGKLFNA